MEAYEILQHLAHKYSECESYLDCGVVDFDDVNHESQQIQFRTEFIRPDYFTFEFQDYGPRRGKSEHFSILWSDGEKNIVRQDTKKIVVEQRPSLQLAIAGADGCSVGAAHIISSLLIEEMRDAPTHLLQLKDLKLSHEDSLDVHPCYVLTGSLFREEDHDLWISSADFVLRRMRIRHSKTAKEAEEQHKALLANTDLMARLSERGIAPPLEIEYVDRHSTTDYTYTTVCFNQSIARLPQPV